MSDFGIEVSDRKDVSNSNPEDLLYSSDFQSPKIARVFSGPITTGSTGNATATVPHTLGYAPAVFAYIRLGDKWYGMNGTTTACETDDTFCTIYITSGGNNIRYYYKFWVFTDPAQELNG